MFVNPLPAKIMDDAMTTSLRTISLTAHAQMDTLVHSAKQVLFGNKTVLVHCFVLYLKPGI